MSLFLKMQQKVSLDPRVNLLGFDFAEFLYQPFNSVSSVLALIAAINTVAKRNDISGYGSWAVWRRQGYPMIHSKCVEQSRRATTGRAISTKVVNCSLPLCGSECIRQLFFAGAPADNNDSAVEFPSLLILFVGSFLDLPMTFTVVFRPVAIALAEVFGVCPILFTFFVRVFLPASLPIFAHFIWIVPLPPRHIFNSGRGIVLVQDFLVAFSTFFAFAPKLPFFARTPIEKFFCGWLFSVAYHAHAIAINARVQLLARVSKTNTKTPLAMRIKPITGASIHAEVECCRGFPRFTLATLFESGRVWGMIGVHQKFAFWCHAQGRFQPSPGYFNWACPPIIARMSEAN